MGYLAINTDQTEDTFCPREYDELRATVAATHLGGDLLPTVQGVVINARMTKGENWTTEGRRFLTDMGIVLCAAAPMVASSSLTA